MKKIFNGIWKENPVFVLMLGMCPTLAVTSGAGSAFGMGIATTCVLAGSNLTISILKGIIPDKVRIPCFIVVIAAFVTIIEMLMKAYAPAELVSALGIYLPLIVVNCIVLGRAEAFASKNGPFSSLLDGIFMGIGFTFALLILGSIREFLGAGTLFDFKIISNWDGIGLFTQSTGAFLVLGALLGFINWQRIRKARRQGKKYIPRPELDCSHCSICNLGKK